MINDTVEVVILGFDGILFNTDIYHYLSWRNTLLPYGINLDQSYQYLTNGFGRSDTLNNILDDFKVELTDKEKLKVLDHKDEIFERLTSEISELECMPNIINFINEIKEKGIKVAVATSSSHSVGILEKTGLNKIFDYTVDEAFLSSKATIRPESYFRILDTLDIKWYRAVVVSSSIRAISQASKALLRTISVGPKKFYKDSLVHVESTSDLTVDLFDKLEEI